MNAMRKYAVWIVALGLAVFIFWKATILFIGVIGKIGSSSQPTVKPQASEPYEPPFRQDGTIYAVNDQDTVATFRGEYAKTPESIEIGMMYRRSVSPDMAMLFFMDGGDRPRSFWMKNTLVSLDIIYINANNEVVSIQANAQPLNTTSLPSEAPASYVLEVLGGTAATWGIEKGTTITWSDN